MFSTQTTVTSALVETLAALVAERPWNYAQINTICDAMRHMGQDCLVHYAGAAHRDDFAWLVVQAWSRWPSGSEAELRCMAHLERGDSVSLAYLEQHYPAGSRFVN